MQRMELRITQLNKAVNQLTAEKEAIDVKYCDLIEDYNSVISERDAFQQLYEKKQLSILKRNIK